MEGHMEEDPFPWWFRPPSSVETINQRNITVENHNNNNNMTSSYVQGIQSSQPQVILINPNQQPQNQLPQNPASPQVILLTPTGPTQPPPPQNIFQTPTTQPRNQLIDFRYNHVNPPRGCGISGSFTEYTAAEYRNMYADSDPAAAFDNVFDVQSLETGLGRLNLSATPRPAGQFLGANWDMWYNDGVSLPSYYGYNGGSQHNMSYFTMENQVDNGLQTSLERSRIHSSVNSSFMVNEGLEDRRLRPSSHSCSSNGFLSSLDLRSQRSSVRSVNGDLGSQRSGGRSINGFLGSQRSGRRSVNGDMGSQRISTGGRSFNGDLGSGGGFSFNILTNPRSQQHRTYSLEEVRGLVCRMAKDPQARCFLEEKIVERNQAFIDLIFSEVIKSHDLFDLILDHNAHHLMQKLVVVLNEDQMNKFILSITNSDRRFLGLCDHVYGTYVMQKLLEGSLTPMHKSLLISTLKSIASILSKTQHGHHVIMHCLRRFSNDFTKDLVEEIVVHSVGLATNKSGCCVLQHCIEHVREGEQKGRLIAEIVNNAVILSGDAYGNYVIQNILDTVPQVVNDVIAQLAGSFIALSTSRFGSNVVEKCMKNADEEQSTAIMLEILSHHDVMEIAKNNYGNYVIQAIWRNSLGRPLIRNTLHHLIQSNYFYLRSHMYGRRVVETVTGNKIVR
ncbi:hypothetical protein Dsin_024278 [Dipteronia sinensis]|uniref:PUM-HD domain-containing protein n=1 Tax=Dipteronia sinensis TaxID=43782 RepID=A0AAD9ZV14_9ROSI|nr:hypothetical protein Dsin_024278 [Dipteronia sinensis]